MFFYIVLSWIELFADVFKISLRNIERIEDDPDPDYTRMADCVDSSDNEISTLP